MLFHQCTSRLNCYHGWWGVASHPAVFSVALRRSRPSPSAR
jgi:hypothetical protein